MKNFKKISCAIIGEGTLPVRCAEILAEEKHQVQVVVSSDPRLKKWAAENAVPLLAFDENLAEELSRFSFDYLFSIVNEHILRADVLSLAQKTAINYHDAPLPRYAGTHATSWALLNGETAHGVSWHVIADAVDAGDILQQQTVEIADDDTALTLNAKCYEAAIDAFKRLVKELASETAAPRAQNLEGRTFFPRFKKPPSGGVISWNAAARDIARLVRALDFGAQPNALGTAKIFLGENFFIVSEIEILAAAPQSAPGTINRLGDDFIQISAADREVILRKLASLNGQPISVSKLAEKFSLRKGDELKELSAEARGRIEKLDRENGRHERFWAARLADLEPATIPFAGGTSSVGAANRSKRKMPIPDRVLRFLEKRTDWKTGEFMLAAFAALLARLSGVEEFDVGVCDAPVESEIAELENFFAAELPVRFTVDPAKNFSEFFAEVERQNAARRKRGTFAFDIFARHPPIRHLSETSDGDFALPVAVEIVREFDDGDDAGRAADLKLLISDAEPNALWWIYNGERISAENVENLTRHFETLLGGIAAEPECAIARLPLLTSEEKSKILVEWNDRRADYPKNLCIQNLFEAQVERTPQATALIFGGERVSYRELNGRANRLAHYLQKIGVRPETLVGIAVERSVEMIVGVLGILKAGGAYVPLDPNYPQERIELMLEDSAAPFLLTKEKTLSALKNHSARVACLDRDWQAIDCEPDANPVSGGAPLNLAYVIYTSGSTGRPKGVAIEHRSAVAFLHWALSVYTPAQLKGVLASTSVCFDLSVYEMFAPLACGGTIILVENALHLPNAAAASEVTLINTVPSAMTELLRIEGVPASVKTVNLAGEPLKPALVRQIYALGSIEKVFDLYGPTEDTTYSTFTLRDAGAATIGRPIANTQAFILDRFLQPVPVGVPGELYLGGDGLARGYLNRPELTAERFIRNPFDEENPAARLYKTGDLTRYTAGGEIEYLGRIDNQVKIRGFRVELGEIEALLATHGGVRETVVVAREDAPGEKLLVAYIVPPPKQSIKSRELREFLKSKLPDYMIPSVFMELAEMPLTPNGKVNRKALPAPAADRFATERDVVAHRDDLEKRLINIWERILKVQPIGVRDDFFELGGHSLQAVRMFAEIEKTFDVNIPLATLFQAGTVEKLAEILRQDGWEARESSLVPIQPEGSQPIFFCVHAKGGNVLFYRDLARRLGTDQPFYGIQARRLGGRQVGHDNLREMAEFYIKEMRTVQPGGPYFLGGTSFGGLAAFEIAQQLRAAGEEIGLLALLDTGTPDYPKFLPETSRWRRKFYSLVRRAQQQRDNLATLGGRQIIHYAVEKLKKIRLKYRRKVRDNYKKAVRKIYGELGGKAAIPKSYIQLEDQIWRAGQNYQPEIYAGKITLFRAALQPLGIEPDPTLGWRDYAGGELEIHEVPGHHGSIVVEPYVAVVAEKLNSCLEKARAEKEGAETEKPGSLRLKKRAVVGV